jgi:hypothetical protein
MGARLYSFASFCLSIGLVGLANVCNVMILELLTRPKKSLHFLLISPVSNLHFILNPKYCLLF